MVTPSPARQFDRALGALLGSAIGDAMGMPAQSLSPDAIKRLYGDIEGFRDAAAAHPFAAGLAAGRITDDTEQSLLLAHQLLESRDRFDEQAWAGALLAWERQTIVRGVHDLLGPSTKRALEELFRGVPPERTGLLGDTNGAAMRIAPVGIATPRLPLEGLVARVREASRITHNTAEAMAAAAAVAAVVSAGVDGLDLAAALGVAPAAARAAEAVTHQIGAVKFSGCLDRALELADTAEGPEACASIAAGIGTSVAACQSVPMAFAIARVAGGDLLQAARISANLGGDTDTMGAIACAMIGACIGASMIPADAVATVVDVNRLDLGPIVEGLLALRRSRSGAPELGPP